jgi:hypothetical protein
LQEFGEDNVLTVYLSLIAGTRWIEEQQKKPVAKSSEKADGAEKVN